MQEHVGKKRRKELREALALRRDKKKTLIKCVAVFGGVAVVVVLMLVLAALEIFLSFANPVVQIVPCALIVAALFFAGGDVGKYGKLNNEYKLYLEKHSISEAELDQYDANGAA